MADRRWVSRDPIGVAGGLNFYRYVLNNPVGLTDASGLEVDAIFDKSAGTVTVTDRDSGESASMSAYSGGNPWGDPIPDGNYDILDRGKDDVFRLEPDDANYGDDTDDATGRTDFRLHGPGRSLGCVTAKDKKEWEKVKNLINKTKTSKATVNSKSRNPFGPKTETLSKYGTLTVK